MKRKYIYETGFYLSRSARPPQRNEFSGAPTSGAQSRGCPPLFVRRCRTTVCSWSREGSHQRKPARNKQNAGGGCIAIFCSRPTDSNGGDIEIIARNCAGKRDRRADNRYSSVLCRIGCDAVRYAVCARRKRSAL